MKKIILSVVMLLLVSCSQSKPITLGPQQWQGTIIIVEVRPGPQVLKGMNEFIVIATKKARTPVSDLIISLRTNETDPWKQAIQDGHIGAYRRAVNVNDPLKDILSVQIRKDDETHVLKFPLAQ